MVRNDRSCCSTGNGADLTGLLGACVFSKSGDFCRGDGSRGECSSRIDRDLERMLNGFGLFFFPAALLVEEGCASPLFEWRDVLDCEGPAACLTPDLS